jgi:hypothetical protein
VGAHDPSELHHHNSVAEHDQRADEYGERHPQVVPEENTCDRALYE